MALTFDPGWVFDASPNAYMVLDHELRYVAANAAYLRAVSRSLDELLGRPVLEVFPHDPADPNNENARRLAASIRRVFDTGVPDVLPLIHYRIQSGGNGRNEDRYWSATHSPVQDADGRVRFVLQHTVDVTPLHQRQAQIAELAASGQVEAGILDRAAEVQRRNDSLDQDLRGMLQVFQQAPGFLCFVRGPEHVVELANGAYYQLVGHRELVGRSIREALPEVETRYFDYLDRVFASAQPFVGRAMPVGLQRTKDSPIEEVHVDFIYQPVVDGRGRTLGIIIAGQDITQQQRAERQREELIREAQAARAEEARARQRAEEAKAELEAIFESFPEALLVGDVRGFTRASAAARDLLGYTSTNEIERQEPVLVRELVPRRVEDGQPLPGDETPFVRALRGEETRMELVITHQLTGEDRVIFCSGAPIRRAGAVTGAVLTLLDVSEQRRAQARALELAKVLDETRDFVGIADLNGIPTFANAAALNLIGLRNFEEARAIPVVDYFVPRERALVRDEVVPTALRGGYWQGELHLLQRRTGEEIPVLYSIFPVRDAAGVITGLATITRDLRAQKAAEAERLILLQNEQAARAQAEEANRLKDQFLAVVSHELRTPLTSILGWMHMLKSGMLPPEKRVRALETVERNARVQAQLIEDLLDVSRIISGKLSMEREPTDIAAMVGAAVETVRPVAEGKGVRLEVEIESSAIVMGDGPRLQQVVWNLLSNAVKFTSAGGHVCLRVERASDAVEIAVRDTGQGIDPEFLPFVFERFRQAEGGASRKLGGLGLGLSIARHVVEAHGGRVWAESDGAGRGARFTVRLPASSATNKTWRAVMERDGAVSRVLDPPAGLQGLHVLVVDDEEDTREYVRTLLLHCRANVTVVSSAAEALQALQRDRPHVLLSDIAMPGEDGYQLIRRVRALPADQGGRIPAVALTAYARAEDRARAMLAGYQNHVTKPVEPVELLAVLASLGVQPQQRDGTDATR